MARKGPLLTLLGGAALAAGLLVVSVNAASEDPPPGTLTAGEVAGAGTAAGATPSPDPATEQAGEYAEEGGTEPEEAAGDDPAAEEAVTYVGSVDGGDASVGIIVTGDEATAYVCDGSEVEAWLRGSAADGELELTGDGGGELVGSYDETSATGETTIDGLEWTFTIEQVDAPEGLYRFAETVVGGAEVEGAWIVLPDGTQVGITSVDGRLSPAPELDLDTGEARVAGSVIEAERLG